MKLVVMRSKKSNVVVDKNIVGEINHGLTILVGISENDTIKDVEYLVNKVLNLRIFDDENGIMNKSILDVKGSILSISQFTLLADTKHGNRPSYKKAMRGSDAVILYDAFNELLKRSVDIYTGIFGSDMLVIIENDGPVTIILDSKDE